MRAAFFLPIALMMIVATALMSPNAAQGQQDLAKLRSQWAELDAKMKKTFEDLDGGDTTPGLADQYKDMVDQANDLIGKMREAGLSSLSENASDAETIRTLMGIMVHDVKNGRDGEVLNLGDALIQSNINPLWFEKAATLGRLELAEKRVFEELVIRQQEATADDLPRVKIVTTKGEIVIELFENEAPNTVNNFVSLVEDGQYSNKLFHRVIEGFMAQTGGFEIDGVQSDSPGYTIPCECRRPDARRHFTHSVSMAHAGPDTGCRQFFINLERTDFLDKRHTVFGRLISGTEVLERIERTAIQLDNGREQPIGKVKKDKILSAEVLRKRDHVYRPRKVGEPEPPPEVKKEKAAEPEKMEEKTGEKKDDNPEDKKQETAAEKGDAKEPAAEKPATEGSKPEKEESPATETAEKKGDGKEGDGNGDDEPAKKKGDK